MHDPNWRRRQPFCVLHVVAYPRVPKNACTPNAAMLDASAPAVIARSGASARPTANARNEKNNPSPGGAEHTNHIEEDVGTDGALVDVRGKSEEASTERQAPVASTCVAAVKNSRCACIPQSGIAAATPTSSGITVSGTRKRMRNGSDCPSTGADANEQVGHLSPGRRPRSHSHPRARRKPSTARLRA